METNRISTLSTRLTKKIGRKPFTMPRKGGKIAFDTKSVSKGLNVMRDRQSTGVPSHLAVKGKMGADSGDMS